MNKCRHSTFLATSCSPLHSPLDCARVVCVAFRTAVTTGLDHWRTRLRNSRADPHDYDPRPDSVRHHERNDQTTTQLISLHCIYNSHHRLVRFTFDFSTLLPDTPLRLHCSKHNLRFSPHRDRCAFQSGPHLAFYGKDRENQGRPASMCVFRC